MTTDSEFLFVLKDGTWWLKITTLEELFAYHDETMGVWEDGFNSLIKSKEFTRHGLKHANDIGYAIGFWGSNRGMNPIEATTGFRGMVIKNQAEEIMSGLAVLINQNGGYHTELADIQHEQFVRKAELIFPNFKMEQIQIKRFPGGEHYYAYIGKMQVKDKDTVKWDSYDEAYHKALSVIEGNSGKTALDTNELER